MDIFTQPEVDPDGLAHLGLLAPMAGISEGTAGAGVHPVVCDEPFRHMDHDVLHQVGEPMASALAR